MTLIIAKGSIEDRVKKERWAEKEIRREEDIRRGITRTMRPERGDYRLCRDLDKTIDDYKRFKSPKDREKIKDEYFGRQAEARKGVKLKCL